LDTFLHLACLQLLLSPPVTTYVVFFFPPLLLQSLLPHFPSPLSGYQVGFFFRYSDCTVCQLFVSSTVLFLGPSGFFFSGLMIGLSTFEGRTSSGADYMGDSSALTSVSVPLPCHRLFPFAHPCIFCRPHLRCTTLNYRRWILWIGLDHFSFFFLLIGPVLLFPFPPGCARFPYFHDSDAHVQLASARVLPAFDGTSRTSLCGSFLPSLPPSHSPPG